VVVVEDPPPPSARKKAFGPIKRLELACLFSGGGGGEFDHLVGEERDTVAVPKRRAIMSSHLR